MRLLKALFKSASTTEPSTAQPSTIEGYSQQDLLRVACGDGSRDEQALRLKAILRLDDAASLIPFSLSDTAKIARSACQRLGALLNEGKVDIKTLQAEISSAERLLSIVAFSERTDLQDRVLNGIKDQTVLAELCRNAEVASVRSKLAERMVAERMVEPEMLRVLAKALKTKDKDAYKILKAKLDTLKAEEHKRQEEEQAINDILSEINSLASRQADKYYPINLSRLQRLWQAIEAGVRDEAKASFNEAAAICEEKSHAFEAKVKADAERNAKLSNLERSYWVVVDNVKQLINQLYSLGNNDLKSISDVNAALQAHKEEWFELKELGKVPEEIKDAYMDVSQVAEELILQVESHGTLSQLLDSVSQAEHDKPSADTNTPSIENRTQQGKESSQVLNQLEKQVYLVESLEGFDGCDLLQQGLTLVQQLEEQSSQKERARKQHIRSVDGLLRKAYFAVEQKRLKQAIGIRYAIDEKLEQITDLPKHLSHKLEEIDEKITKLVDLQASIVKPKKEALIKSMEQLVGVAMAPEFLAERIKRLQDQWRELSHANQDTQEELWQSFSELANRAYEPCKEHYQAMADLRQNNLAKRHDVIQQLQDFDKNADWQNADWKVVEKIIGTAKKEFHSYSPINRSEGKAVAELFTQALATIEEKLNKEYDKNKLAKEQLIKQAAKLADIKDLDRAIDNAKRLQSQWKKGGRCRYADSQQLWNDFRAQCNVVFDKKQQEREDQKKQEDIKLNELRDIIAEVKTIIKLPAEEFLSARSQREQLVEKFNAIEDVPDQAKTRLSKELEKSLERFDKRVKSEIASRNTQAWKSIFEACEQLNACLASSADDSAAKDDMLATLNDIDHWPENLLPLMKQKLATPNNVSEQESLEQLRELCVRIEIVVDKESPKEDQALRADYQLKRLKTNFGEVSSQQQQARELLKSWVSTGPVAQERYATYFARFTEAWHKVKAETK